MYLLIRLGAGIKFCHYVNAGEIYVAGFVQSPLYPANARRKKQWNIFQNEGKRALWRATFIAFFVLNVRLDPLLGLEILRHVRFLFAGFIVIYTKTAIRKPLGFEVTDITILLCAILADKRTTFRTSHSSRRCV